MGGDALKFSWLVYGSCFFSLSVGCVLLCFEEIDGREE